MPRARQLPHLEFSVYFIVVLLAPSYKRWAKNRRLNIFVQGVTAAATGAIAGAVIVLARRSIYDVATPVIALASLLILLVGRFLSPSGFWGRGLKASCFRP